MSRTIRHKDPRYFDEEHIHRDKKDWQKPPSSFKKVRSRVRKAKVKDAMKHIEDENTVIPNFKKDDVWDWN
jgi:hypothetical protein